MPRARSVLIAVEGIDGAGKTTQVNMLREALSRVGELPVVSKEPTNGPWGKLIKESATSGRLSLGDELEAFINDRREHVNSVVLPALEDARIVILDRYFYSSIAYQGSRGANFEEVKVLMESTFPVPDATFILDIDPSLSVYRIAHSRGEVPNHFEERANLVAARQIFKQIIAPQVFHIDGSMSREAVHHQIINAFVDSALKARRCAKEYGCDDPFNCLYRLTGTCEWAKMARAIRSLEPIGTEST